MKLRKYIGLMTAGLVLALSTSTQATPIGAFGNFEDNGLTVLEYRDDGTTWEWLDLTVTTGISYNSLVTDLNNDGLLNNSGNVLNGNAGALKEVADLTDDLRGGWGTVSDLDVIKLFNSFFDLTLVDGQVHELNTNTNIVLDFILAFGDTHNDRWQVEGTNYTNWYTTIPYTAITEGITNTKSTDMAVETTTVYITEYNYSGNYFIRKFISTDAPSAFVDAPYDFLGTWLVREVEVPTPSTIGLFALAIMGLGARRFRKG